MKKGILQNQARMPFLFTLEGYGVDILTSTKAEKITESGVVVSQSGEKMLIEADTIALAVGYKGRNEFSESFKMSAPEVYVIGNSLKPGNILDAVHHGFEVAIKI